MMVKGFCHNSLGRARHCQLRCKCLVHLVFLSVRNVGKKTLLKLRGQNNPWRSIINFYLPGLPKWVSILVCGFGFFFAFFSICSEYTAFKHHSRFPSFSYIMVDFTLTKGSVLPLAFFFLLCCDHGKDTQVSQWVQTIWNKIYEKLIIRDKEWFSSAPRIEFLGENA